eukprot:2506417-Rhodomonas_salina.4
MGMVLRVHLHGTTSTLGGLVLSERVRLYQVNAPEYVKEMVTAVDGGRNGKAVDMLVAVLQ